MDRRQRIPIRTTMIPDSFKVLPPLSPELPAPPPAPKPNRVAPLSVSRRDQSAFVILAESASRSPSPVSGRISPFRGRGFKTPTSSRHPSRDPTPERSRSKLPVARPTGRDSVSSSPSRNTKPVVRRNSLSPGRATRAMNQINRNKSFVSSKNTQNIKLPLGKQPGSVNSSPVRRVTNQLPSKRVGPLNVKNQNSKLITKPPIPKTTQKKTEHLKQSNFPSGKKQTENIADNKQRSPSKIPRNRNANLGKITPPSQKSRVKPAPSVQQRSKGDENAPRPSSIGKSTNKADNSEEPKDEQKVADVSETVHDTNTTSNETGNHRDGRAETGERSVVEETPIKAAAYTKTAYSTESEPPEVTSSDGLSIKSKVTITSLADEDIPETSITLVRTTTAPALELAQLDVIPDILTPTSDKTTEKPKDKIEEKETTKRVEVKDTIVNDEKQATEATGLSVESVRSTSSVETVRAVAKVKATVKKQEEDVKGSIKEEGDAEVLSANNLIRTDSMNNNSNRTVAWETA